MPETFRPLGLVKEMVNSLGLEVTYAYEDLVFVEHNAFLLQFDDEKQLVRVYINHDCPEEEVQSLAAGVADAAAGVELPVELCGRYAVTTDEHNESFSVHFS